jgi:hypothetical protein
MKDWFRANYEPAGVPKVHRRKAAVPGEGGRS